MANIQPNLASSNAAAQDLSASRVQNLLENGFPNQEALKAKASVLDGIIANLAQKDVQEAQALLSLVVEPESSQSDYNARTFAKGTTTLAVEEERYEEEAEKVETLAMWYLAGSDVMELIWARVGLAQEMLAAGLLRDDEAEEAAVRDWVASMTNILRPAAEAE